MRLHNITGRLCSYDVGEDIIIRGWQMLSWALANQGADKDTYPSFRGVLDFSLWSLIDVSRVQQVK